MKALEGFFPIRGEIWSADRCYCAREESRFPLFIGGLPFCSFLSLLFFDLCLECRGEGVLPAYYGIGDVIPELEGFIGELLLEWRDHFGYWVERIEVDDKVLFLKCY